MSWDVDEGRGVGDGDTGAGGLGGAAGEAGDAAPGDVAFAGFVRTFAPPFDVLPDVGRVSPAVVAGVAGVTSAGGAASAWKSRS